MKRSLIIGAALLVQSAMAQETNQLDDPTEAPLKFFWGHAYKSDFFEPARKVEGEWVFIPAGRDTSETNLNFIYKPGWQISEETNEPPTSVPTRFQAWTFPKAGEGSTNEKSINGWDEYVQSGDYEAATNRVHLEWQQKKWTVISNVFVADPDAIERETRARLAFLNQHEDEIIKAYKVGAKKFFWIGTVIGFAAGALCFMRELPKKSR